MKALTKIQDKLRYYRGYETKHLEKFIETNTRKDRDTLIRVRERCKIYEECITVIKDNL